MTIRCRPIYATTVVLFWSLTADAFLQQQTQTVGRPTRMLLNPSSIHVRFPLALAAASSEQSDNKETSEEGGKTDGTKKKQLQQLKKQVSIGKVKFQKVLDRISQMQKKVDWLMVDQSYSDFSAEEAQASAGMYLTAATANISPDVKVSWEPKVAELLTNLRKVSNPDRPMMVGVVGIPGSGKSTSCETLASYLEVSLKQENQNEQQQNKQSSKSESRENDDDTTTDGHGVIVIPMDGYHYPLKTLSKFPNAADAIYRRGAPDTFNSMALERDLERIAFGMQDEISIPGFDHAVGDPEENQHNFVRSQHDIVICEGIYLLHNDDGWENIQKFFDWTIFIDSDLDSCISRLKMRNKIIPGYTPEEIETRVDAVDRVNCEIAQDAARRSASQIVKSPLF